MPWLQTALTILSKWRFGANIDADVEMLKMGGSIGAYATDNATPKIPFWS